MSLVNEIIKNYLYVGTLKPEANPKTRKFWAGTHNGMVIIEPTQIEAQLTAAKNKIAEAKKDGKNILVICEKSVYRNEMEDLAQQLGVHYLNYRVPSGVMTNFDTLLNNISSMNKLRNFIQSPQYASLTKKERLMRVRQLEKLEKTYKGVQGLSRRPDLVVIVDAMYKPKFIDETVKSGIDTIIITSTNLNRFLDSNKLIIANMNSFESIDTIVKTIFGLK